MSSPSASVLRWAIDVFGGAASIVAEQALHDGLGPWHLTIEADGKQMELVLRTAVQGRTDAAMVNTGAAALEVAERYGLPAPRLIAWDQTGDAAGEVASLESALPGVSDFPPIINVVLLRTAGATLAKVHHVHLAPQSHLKVRTRPIQVDDHAADRRWATLFRASPLTQRRQIVDAFCKATGANPVDAVAVLSRTWSTPLLSLADEIVRNLSPRQGPSVFLHGDVWPGNMRFLDGVCTALIDWKTAGVGNPGVDLGSLRLQTAIRYGAAALDHVTTGWEQEFGEPASDLAYWDAVAALNTPADMEGWPGFDDKGGHLSFAAVADRRDLFLSAALAQLH